MLRRRANQLATPLLSRAAATTAAATSSAPPGPLTTSAKIFGAANLLGLGVSLATGSHYHLDLLGTGAFAVAAAATAGGGELRQRASAAAVGLWSTKLATFLVYRVQHTTHDARLDDTLASTSGAVGFWTVSCLWGWLVSLPHTLAAATPVQARPPFGRAADIAGLLLFGLGLAVESVADWQKWTFKQDPANRGRFCDAGVWKASQHPNWFGNLTLWTGILLLNAPALLSPARSVPRRAGALLAAAGSPLFMVALFYGQASGAISNTVALAERRYGDDPAFAEYVSSTPLIVPTPQSLARLLDS